MMAAHRDHVDHVDHVGQENPADDVAKMTCMSSMSDETADPPIIQPVRLKTSITWAMDRSNG